MDAAPDADIVVFPELFTAELYCTYDDWTTAPLAGLGRIDEFTAEYLAFFADIARTRGQHVLGGSHLLRDSSGRYFNVANLFTPDGVVHQHVKTHIFPAEAEWGTEEGSASTVISLPFGRVGVNICYEAEFPECAAAAAAQGAEVILCPSFTFTEFGFWRVRQCGHARAVENQIYFVHASCGGSLGAPLPDGWAQSSILSPCGPPWNDDGVVAQSRPHVEEVVQAVVDLDALGDAAAKGVAGRRDRFGVRFEAGATRGSVAEGVGLEAQVASERPTRRPGTSPTEEGA